MHPEEYLSSLCNKSTIAKIVEMPQLAVIPGNVLRWLLLECMLLATQGTVGKIMMRFSIISLLLDGAIMALKRGLAINLSGGYHHASSNKGGGFCIYADITIAIKNLLQYYPKKVKKVMIIDLDAHQGNGHEKDFTNDPSVFIIDVYNHQIYPKDFEGKKGISLSINIYPEDNDDSYLNKLIQNIPNAVDSVKPDFILYNAGTDILQGDNLGSIKYIFQQRDVYSI